MKPSILFGFLLFCALWPQPSTTRNVYPLDKAIKELSAIARVTNGIAMQTQLSKNPNKLNDIVAEFLGAQSGDDIVKLKSLAIDGVSKQLGEFFATVQAVPAPQVQDTNSMKEKMAKLNQWKDNMSILQNVNDPTNAIQGHIAGVKDGLILTPTTFQSVADALEIVIQESAADIGGKTILTNFIKLQTDLSAMVGETRTLSNYETNWASFLSLGDAGDSLKPVEQLSQVSRHIPSLVSLPSPLKDDLGSLQNDASALSTVLSQHLKLSIILVGVQQSLNHMSALSSLSGKQKHLTAGLPNGVADLVEMNKDLTKNVLPKLISEGKPLKSLHAELKLVRSFQTQMLKVLRRWSQLADETTHLNHLEELFTILSTASSHGAAASEISNLDSSLTSVKSCITSLSLPTKAVNYQDFDAVVQFVENISKKAKNFKTVLNNLITDTAYASALTEINSVSTKLRTLNTSSTTTAASAMFTDIKASIELNGTVATLRKIITEVTALQTPIPFSLVTTNLNMAIITDVVNSLDGTELIATLDCLKSAQSYKPDDIDTMLGFGADIQELKTKKVEVNFTINYLDSIAKVNSGLSDIANAVSAGRTRRRRATSSKSISNLKNAQKIATDLGRGVQVLREYQKIKNTKPSIQVATKAQGPLKSAVDAIQGTQGVWTEDNRKSLDKLLVDLSGMEGSVGRVKRNNMSSLFHVFDEADKVQGFHLEAKYFKDPIGEELAKSADPNIQAAAQDFNKIGALDLNFVQHHTYLKAASGTLAPLQSFFDDFFGIDRTRPTPAAPAEEGLSLFAIIGIAVGGAVFLALAGVALYHIGKRVIYWKQQRDRWKNPDRYFAYRNVPTTPTVSNSLSIAAQENNLFEVKNRVKEGVYIDTYFCGYTPLRMAIYNNNMEMVLFLLKSGASQDLYMGDHWTPQEKCENKCAFEKENKLAHEIKAVLDAKMYYGTKQYIPPLPPFEQFIVTVPLGHSGGALAEQINKKYPGFYVTEKRQESPTHMILSVNKDNVFHMRDGDYRLVVSTAIKVPIGWLHEVKKSKKNCYKDWDMRIKKFEYQGKEYDMDLWTKWASMKAVGPLYGFKIHIRGYYSKCAHDPNIDEMYQFFELHNAVCMELFEDFVNYCTFFEQHEDEDMVCNEYPYWWYRDQPAYIMIFDGKSENPFKDYDDLLKRWTEKNLMKIMTFREFLTMMFSSSPYDPKHIKHVQDHKDYKNRRWYEYQNECDKKEAEYRQKLIDKRAAAEGKTPLQLGPNGMPFRPKSEDPSGKSLVDSLKLVAL